MNSEKIKQVEKMQKLYKELEAIENERLNGAKYYSVDEVDSELTRIITEARKKIEA